MEDLSGLSNIEYYKYFNNLSEEEIFEYIYDLSDIDFYNHIIRYIDYFKLTKDFIVSNSYNNVYVPNPDYSDYYDLDLGSIYTNFRQFLEYHGFESLNYLDRIYEIQSFIMRGSRSTIEDNLRFISSASISDIEVFFTFIEGRNNHFGEIILSRYDCDVYIAGLSRIKEIINDEDSFDDRFKH
ncbi:hypothetical protein [uncultured Methanobrevibacter sp.]|uniref:hypothetical protein n=1 Tax=uncultured Methanobrevibacter sp. TaxID=253161 RepID=UPI002586DD7A|nr:hypothetical protein [uncultured Methanobrevibacter sp.]